MAIAVFIAAIALGLGYGARHARGDGGVDQAQASLPTPRQTKEALESPSTQPLEETTETDLKAASELPHRDLERDEALKLAEGVFETELESPAGIYDEFEPDRFLSNYAAVVPSSDLPEPRGEEIGEAPTQGPSTPVLLLESSLPLRAENGQGEEEAVDLTLQRSEGELQPENPLTEVAVPTQLGEGVGLPGAGVSVEVTGAPAERAASNVEGQYAFYPNVAENTDLIVAPTPTGVEMMTDIRSSEAPQKTTFRISLPAEATLKANPGGGAEVVQDGRTTVVIPPPTATDAAGNPVPVELRVNGNQLEVEVSPQPSSSFPILVDPTYNVEGWHWTLQHDSLAAWSTSSTTGGYAGYPYEVWNPTWYPGLDVSSGGWGNAAWGGHADWSYWVPRYQEDLAKYGTPPSTWVWQMYTEGVLFLPWGNTQNYPVLVMGLVDPNYGWEVAGTHYGGQGEMNNWYNNFTFTNEYEQVNTKGADMNLVTYENEYPAKGRDTYIAYATIAVADTDVPKIVQLNPPAEWVNGYVKPITYEFEDKGLGVRRAEVIYNGSGTTARDYECGGTAISPCPRIVTAARGELEYKPQSLPTGKDKLEVKVSDPLGPSVHSTTGAVVVKVDHTPPEISLSGSLTEQASLGTHRPAYALRVNATDGTESAPQSGIGAVSVSVDGEAVPVADYLDWRPECETQNCPFAGELTLNAAEFTAGAHELEVSASDAVGNSTTKKLRIELHPPKPSLGISGSITEQTTLGTELPRYKLKISASAFAESPLPASAPTFSSAFGSAGAGNGQFNHPGDIAVDSSGNLWVADTTNNRIEEFSSAGTWLRTVGTTGTGSGQLKRPTALAFDASNHLWVVDSGNKRLEEFSAGGEYLAKFGSGGTGDGQFAGSGPEGIAIDYHGNIWVTDTYGGRIEEFSGAGVFKRSIGTRGQGWGEMIEPTSIEIGPGGNLWVTDWGKNKVLEFPAAGQYPLREFGTEGSGNGEFRHPDGIAIDSKGDVWVGDQNNERVQEFNQAGEFLGKFGTAGSGQGQFNLGYPIGIATDAAGDVWVTDTGNNRIQKWVVPGYANPPGPSLLRSIGSYGAGNGQFNWPTGVAVDSKGNIWVTDFFNSRIQKFNENGAYLSQFGAGGSGNGQFKYPIATAIDPKGRLWVVDAGNDRVQEFSETGAFIRAFGTLGSGNGQMNSPSGIAIDSQNHIWVTDTLNARIEEFSETGAFIRSVGTKGSGSGQLLEPYGVGVTSDGKVWVSDIANNRLDEFTESGSFAKQIGGPGSGIGQFNVPTDVEIDANGNLWVDDEHNQRIEEFDSQGEFIQQFGSPAAGQGEFKDPQNLALDGKGHLLVADYTANKVSEWTLQPPHSQISTEVVIDGKRVNAAETACQAATCSTEREWTLESSTLAPGRHTVQVKAADGVGNTTSKEIPWITIEPDHAKPSLEIGGELASAPEGWVEQETYGFHATSEDRRGSGVTSLVFKIDGATVASKTQSCPEAECSATIATSVDMGTYGGGAHEAEVVASDGAGNAATKRWTINVDPEGHISTSEAEATLEAMEATAPVNVVGPAEEEAIEGTASGLGIAAAEGSEEPGAEIAAGFEATNTSVPVVIGEHPDEGAEFHVLPEDAFQVPCPDLTESQGEPAPDEPEEVDEPETTVEDEECVSQVTLAEAATAQEEEVANGVKYPGLQPITVRPVVTAGDAGLTVATGDNATLSTNTAQSVDTVMRPLSDGGLSFETIRDESAPEHYAFEMNLSPELELRQVNEQEVVVYYKVGFPAFTISAVAAHDAVGTTVPTTLSVTEANVITLTVSHRGGSFVYPIISGAGWEGGYRTITVDLTEPPPESEEEIDEATAEEDSTLRRVAVGPPISVSNDAVPVLLRDPTNIQARERMYRAEDCALQLVAGEHSLTPPPQKRLDPNQWKCIGETVWEEGQLKGIYKPRWAVMMRGLFRYKRGSTVWIESSPECFQWGRDQPHQIRCYAESSFSHEHINLFGQFRFDPYQYLENFAPICYEINPTLSPSPPLEGRSYLYDHYHLSRGPREFHQECDWHHLHQVF